MSSTADVIEYPSSLAPLLEVRVILEVLSCFAYLPALKRLAPAGDGHPVLTIPPFMSDDKFMSPMRGYLEALGYSAHGWDMGQNTGFDEERFAALLDRIKRISQEQDAKVSLIGHSLGGIYARIAGHELKDHVRQVIYLGSPFRINDEQSADLPIRKIYEKINPDDVSDLMKNTADMGATPMPSTAIYSEGDGFVPWQFCVDEVDANSENLRVPGSHTGMPFNLPILYAIADRLSQPEDDWQPFDMSGLRSYVFGTRAS